MCWSNEALVTDKSIYNFQPPIKTLDVILLFKTKKHISYIKKTAVESLEIHLQQVTKQRQRFRSWRLSPLFLGAEAGVKQVDDQNAYNSPQQGDRSVGLEKIFQHDLTVTTKCLPDPF